MELKEMPFLTIRNVGINFFGSLVVSQDAVMKLNNVPITDYKVYEGLMNSRICHGFNDILVIDLKELVMMYVYMRANKKEVIDVLDTVKNFVWFSEDDGELCESITTIMEGDFLKIDDEGIIDEIIRRARKG